MLIMKFKQINKQYIIKSFIKTINICKYFVKIST